MKTKFTRREGVISLIIDDPMKKPRDSDVLASMTLYEGTGCWTLIDIRLTKHRKPSKYSGSPSSDDYHAQLKPETEDAAEFIKSQLREYIEDSEGIIHWCNFDGIVKGKEYVNNYRPHNPLDFHPWGYFSRDEGVKVLKEIKAFWDDYDGDPSKVRLPNSNRQASLSELLFELLKRDWDAIKSLPQHSGIDENQPKQSWTIK